MAIPASRFDEFPSVAPIDALDRACQDHDRDCSRGGCSSAGDRKLAFRALRVALSTKNPLLARKAQAIAAAMTAASITRSR